MRRAIRVPFLAILSVLAFTLVRDAFWRPFDVAGSSPRDDFTRVSGVVHVHTTLSDGGGTPAEVIGAAKAAGLDFLFLTDHNHLDAKPLEGYSDGVLVLVGAEISTDAGHLIALGIPDPRFRFSGDARDALEDVRDLGGAAFAAHPGSPRADFQWTGWELPGPWGVELLNGDSQWRAAGWSGLSRAALAYVVNPNLALLRSATAPGETVRRWDDLLAERDTPMIAGADAHSRVRVSADFHLRLPSYEALFAQARNVVLLERPLSGEARTDGGAIVEALARGRSYFGLDALAPAGGFYFEAEQGDRRWPMGATVPPSPAPRLRAGGRLPREGRISLLRNGETVIAEGEGEVSAVAGERGVYRVEVRLPGWEVPWIFSNPIYVFDDEAAAERRAKAQWPVAPRYPPATAAQLLDAFESGTAFEVNADPSTTVARDVIDPQGGADGKGAARLQFRLGVPDGGNPSPFCALVSWERRDLSGRRGIVFSVRSDDVYRLWVQVRDENPQSEDGTEWWFTSVRTSTSWEKVSVPFERLRTRDARSDGRLDPSKVRAVVFLVDVGAVKPGTEGVIWIDEVGVY